MALYRIRERRVYWRWFAELDLEGGPTLRLSGDAARWLRPGDEVELNATGRAEVLDKDEYELKAQGVPVWPPFGSEELKQPDGSRLRAREAHTEADYEAIAALERYQDAGSKAVWRCPDGSRRKAAAKPRCGRGWGRLLEVAGSTPASRFLILEVINPAPASVHVVAYLRLDPPLPTWSRRTPAGPERGVRERAFPPPWFSPTYDPKALLPAGRPCRVAIQDALDALRPAAARIGRLLVHPDQRGRGLGALLVRQALSWVSERAIPDGRREKELVCAHWREAAFNPLFERVGFRYLGEGVFGEALLAYPLSDAAAGRLRRFLNNDLPAREHGGRLWRAPYPRQAGLPGPLVFQGAGKSLAPASRAGGRRWLLRDVNLRLPPGKVSLLWGEAEAAKTALLRLLWDDLPDEGWVDAPPGRVAAHLPGAEATLPAGTVLELTAARLGDVAVAAGLLSRLGLADSLLWNLPPERLSPAQLERLRLALLLAGRPDLLLVDRPAAHQDAAGAYWLARSLAALAREGNVTLVAASSRPEVRAGLAADRLVLIGFDSVRAAPGDRPV